MAFTSFRLPPFRGLAIIEEPRDQARLQNPQLVLESLKGLVFSVSVASVLLFCATGCSGQAKVKVLSIRNGSGTDIKRCVITGFVRTGSAEKAVELELAEIKTGETSSVMPSYGQLLIPDKSSFVVEFTDGTAVEAELEIDKDLVAGKRFLLFEVLEDKSVKLSNP